MSSERKRQAADPWPDFGGAGDRRGDAGGRRTVFVQALALGAGGLLLYVALGRHLAGLVVWGLALVVLATGSVSAGARRFLRRLSDRLQLGVGRALAWLLLTPVFFLIFTPAALVARLLGRDPLRLRALPPAASYWRPRDRLPAPDSYRRQFSFEEAE